MSLCNLNDKIGDFIHLTQFIWHIIFKLAHKKRADKSNHMIVIICFWEFLSANGLLRTTNHSTKYKVLLYQILIIKKPCEFMHIMNLRWVKLNSISVEISLWIVFSETKRTEMSVFSMEISKSCSSSLSGYCYDCYFFLDLARWFSMYFFFESKVIATNDEEFART